MDAYRDFKSFKNPSVGGLSLNVYIRRNKHQRLVQPSHNPTVWSLFWTANHTTDVFIRLWEMLFFLYISSTWIDPTLNLAVLFVLCYSSWFLIQYKVTVIGSTPEQNAGTVPRGGAIMSMSMQLRCGCNLSSKACDINTPQSRILSLI